MQIMYLKVDSDLKYINYTLDSKKKQAVQLAPWVFCPFFYFITKVRTQTENKPMQKEVSGSWHEGEIPLHTYQDGDNYTDVIGTRPMTDAAHQELAGGVQKTGSPGTCRQEGKVANSHLKIVGNWFEN